MLDDALKNANHRIVGLKQTQRALEKGLVCRVYIAGDAEGRLTGPLKELCARSNVEVKEVSTMDELGKACGIEVSAAVAALLKQ